MQQQKMTLHGTITSINHDTNYPQKTKLCITATSMCTDTSTAHYAELLPAYLQIYSGLRIDLEPGDTIVLENVMCNKPSEDYARYLAREYIDATLFIKKEQIKHISRPYFSIRRWLYHKKKQCFAALQTKMSPQTFAFFSSLFLGDKKTNKKEMSSIKNNFKTWGISHYLARSGLHMIIFIAVWQLILIFFPLAYLYKELLLIALALIYCVLTIPSISFNRAVLAFLLYKLYALTGNNHTHLPPSAW